MSKYIDVNELIAEIERLTNQKKEKLKGFSDEDYTCSVASSINCELWGNEEVLSIITSLQQEQPNYKKMLELLLESISYAYAKTDGTYGDLAYVVSDKVRYIEEQLREFALKRK